MADSNELPEFLKMLLGAARRQQPDENEVINQAKDFFTPSWGEVLDKKGAISMWKHQGTQFAEHDCNCNDIECKINHGDKPTWASPHRFLAAVMTAIEKLTEQSEDMRAIRSFWIETETSKIETDPRYIAFRCYYDNHLLDLAITRDTIRAPSL